VIPPDPNWPRASEWLHGPPADEPARRLEVIGAPVRLGSLSGGRFDLAPSAIRAALDRFSAFDGETDIGSVAARDAGDLPIGDRSPEEALDDVVQALGEALPRADAVVLLGGDNSITRPAVRGLGLPLDRVGLITIDAHHDLRDTAGGLTNGNPVRALLEEGLPGRNVAQIGIQPFANSRSYAAVATEAGIAVRTAEVTRERGMGDVLGEALADIGGRVETVYVDLDLDVLDRAFAPACPGSRPGGLGPADILTAARLAGENPSVRALDIVEVDPERDIAGTTALTAAGCLLWFTSGLARRNG
jgi:formiminoglutamase